MTSLKLLRGPNAFADARNTNGIPQTRASVTGAIEHYCFAYKLLRWSYQDEWALLKEEKKHFARHGRKYIVMREGKPTIVGMPKEHRELIALREKKLEANKP